MHSITGRRDQLRSQEVNAWLKRNVFRFFFKENRLVAASLDCINSGSLRAWIDSWYNPAITDFINWGCHYLWPPYHGGHNSSTWTSSILGSTKVCSRPRHVYKKSWLWGHNHLEPPEVMTCQCSPLVKDDDIGYICTTLAYMIIRLFSLSAIDVVKVAYYVEKHRYAEVYSLL